jgi:polyhydroxybutyrate depolymerase
MTPLRFVGLLGGLAVMFASACSSTSSPAASGAVDAAAPIDEADAAPPPAPDTPDPRLAGRPYDVYVPKGYDASRAAPLVLAFHGYGDGDDGPLLEKYFRLKPVADRASFLYVTPNGTKDSLAERFWNGTDACCDFDKTKPDDVGYVRALVADVAKHYSVDPKRIYAVGLSGGGFFVHRLACDASDLFAAVISVSGATYADETKCAPKEGVSLVELHGDKDAMVAYAGGTLDYNGSKADYPSAKDTVAHWAAHDGCSGALVPSGTSLDLVANLAGAETTVEHYPSCTKGAVELWTVKGGVHAPAFGAAFAPALWHFFEGHPKP